MTQMRSYTDKRSKLSSPYFRMGMLDGHRLVRERDATDSLFTSTGTANAMLAYEQYKAGYLAGLDSRPMPHYELHKNMGRVGGSHRVLSINL